MFGVCRNLKIGYFSQHHVDQLDLNVNSVELLLNRFPGRFPCVCARVCVGEPSGRGLRLLTAVLLSPSETLTQNPICSRTDGGGVPAPAGTLRDHRGAGHQAGGQPVRRSEEPGGLRSDDHAMVGKAPGGWWWRGGGGDDVMCLSSSPNFYVLDEPTNHLDMETIEALAKALNKFKVGFLLLRPAGWLRRFSRVSPAMSVSGRGRPGVT